MSGRLLLVIVLFSVITLAAVVDISALENILENGDFEDGEAGWAVASRGDAAMEFIIDDAEYISGEKSARFEISNIGGGGTHDLTLDSQTSIQIAAGEPHTVDFWMKAEEERTITIDCLMNHDPWSGIFRIENIPVTTEWQVRYHTFTADFDDDNLVFLFSFSRASNQNPLVTMWIDRVRFYEGEFEEEELPGEPSAVTPGGKLAGSWGAIKAGNRY
jgi:hypothetical protein